MRAIAMGMTLGLVVGLGTHGAVLAQGKGPPIANQQRLAEIRQSLQDKGVASRAAARDWAARHAVPLRRELPNGRVLELQRLGPRGPVFYITNNLDAADSISTDELWEGGGLGLNLEGQGMTVGEWDSGRVLLEHPDLYLRSVQMDEGDDPAPVHSDHATHVAGTLIGSGGSQYVQARGMAPQAHLQAWDWNKDLEEMAAAAAGGLLVSNHSYSIAAGWIPYGQAEPDNWWWIGGSGDEDPNFGYYDAEAQTLDQIANAAPHYLIVKAAGNDRWDIGPEPGETYTIVNQDGVSQGTSTQQRPADCGQTGYDCLPGGVVAKNILTVGAVNDVIGGYLPLQGPGSVQLTGFSSFGPTDDGRIKPDLVANGWLLLSTWGAPNYFAVIAGTSMAAPSVSGSLLLLQQHYQSLPGNSGFMRAATLKALAIHTADESGAADGPDYEYGWGLMNTKKAAELISQDGSADHRIVEATRTETPAPDTVNFTVSEEGARVRVTLVWNDPAAVPAAPVLDPAQSMLVNDLDLRVLGNSSSYQPWVLNPLAPAAAATRGDNARDNVEMVEFVASAGSYTVQVSHKDSLQGGSQDYSLIVSVRPPAPVSSGLIIDEHFEGVSLPAGWSIDTSRGLDWAFFADGSGDFDNQTGSAGAYAMLYNRGVNDTLSDLVLPPLDLTTSESVVLRFSSHYSFADAWESIGVFTSADGGASWSLAQSLPLTNHFPSRYTLDLSNKIAGAGDARIAFRFDSGYFGIQGFNWQVDAVELEVFGGGSTGGDPPPPLELPGQADLPGPVSGAMDVVLAPTLSWVSAPNALSHNVYFGTSLDLQSADFQGNQTGAQFSPGTLVPETQYFWRVDEVNDAGTTPGVVWNFTTEPAEEPPPPTGPTTLHVADLDMSVESLARNRWQANVRVQVRDDEGNAVASAEVTGEWSNGANGSDTQVTDAGGWAAFSKSNLKAGVSSVTFAVSGITHASLSYQGADNSDPDGDSDGSSILVPRDAPPPPVNSQPVVSITAPAGGQVFTEGTAIALVASATDAEEGDLSSAIVWRVNGVEVASGASASHDFPDGNHNVSATATDAGGASGSDTVTITVGDVPSDVAVHVSGLVDVSSADSRRWTAAALVTVQDTAGSPVSNVTVTGSWSSGARGSATCVTGATGQCELSKGNLKLNVDSVILTIDSLAGTGMVYDPSGPSTIVLAP